MISTPGKAAIVASLSLLSACTWVQLDTGAEAVQVRDSVDLSACTRLGRARAQTMDEVVTLNRSGSRMQQELITLARNEAAAMGGNVIVAESIIEEGEQLFGVYSCP